MNLETIQTELSTLFAASHRFKHDGRRVIFWFDAEIQFSEVFAALELAGVQKVLHSGAWFKLKYDLHRTFASQNVLVYAPFAEPAVQHNFVYDVQVTGLKFSADRANMVFLRLGLQDKSLETYLKTHEKFLGAQSRVDALFDLSLPSDANEVKLRVAMLCVILNIKIADAGLFVRKLLKNGTNEAENADWLELQKFFELSELWDAIFQATGYSDKDDLPTLAKLFNGLSVTHLRRRWVQHFPLQLEHFVLRPDSSAVQIVQTWLDSKEAVDYKRLAEKTEKTLSIAELARDAGSDALRDADSFAAIEQAVIRDCVEALKDRRVTDARRWIETRTRIGWHWEQEFKAWYDVLDAASLFLSTNWQNLPISAAELWSRYQTELYVADRAYREFCAAFAPLESKGAELLKPLSDFIERLYIEDYLEQLGQAWSNVLEDQQGQFLVGFAAQNRFFDQVVQPALEKSRVAVVISDALRFELGMELLEALKTEDGLELELSARVTGLPSVTKTGMAALLPGLRLGLNAAGVVLRDGQATNTTEARDAILKARVPKSRAIQENDLTLQKRDEARAWIQQTELLYVYHNIIDTTGESAALELDVPEASNKTLRELQNLVKRLIKHLNVTQVFVTADHGFLFQRRNLEDYEKLSGDKSGEVLEASKRYTVGHDLTAVDGAQRFASSLENLEVIVPRGSLRFITPGRGTQYVHGGASLQEIMIPVLSVRAARGKSATSNKVNVALQQSGASKRITGNPFTVTLAQLEPVSEVLLARKIRLAWYDPGNVPVTQELRLVFDSSASSVSERIQKHTVRLTLNAPNRFTEYTLIVRDSEDDAELQREVWRIDLAIPDDFGI